MYIIEYFLLVEFILNNVILKINTIMYISVVSLNKNINII